MGEAAAPWRLERFLERLDQWIAREHPPESVRLSATEWLLSRLDDPYEGVRRESGFENLWYGPIPSTEHDGLVVLCSYWIVESERIVRCDGIATLTRPI